ncbi:hypothetical protein BJ912DRAFT_962710 [Pholiota molesta]|nr:hypothetical protein BJ912DRAFT_962710 [Pholiota molesta]
MTLSKLCTLLALMTDKVVSFLIHRPPLDSCRSAMTVLILPRCLQCLTIQTWTVYAFLSSQACLKHTFRIYTLTQDTKAEQTLGDVRLPNFLPSMLVLCQGPRTAELWLHY